MHKPGAPDLGSVSCFSQCSIAAFLIFILCTVLAIRKPRRVLMELNREVQFKQVWLLGSSGTTQNISQCHHRSAASAKFFFFKAFAHHAACTISSAAEVQLV